MRPFDASKKSIGTGSIGTGSIGSGSIGTGSMDSADKTVAADKSDAPSIDGFVADRGVGIDGRDAPVKHSAHAGSQNSTIGIGMLDMLKRKTRRGLSVALIGIALLQGGFPLSAGSATPGTPQRVMMRTDVYTAMVNTVTVPAGAPPTERKLLDTQVIIAIKPPDTAVEQAVAADVAELVSQPIASLLPGRDVPVMLTLPDGTRADLSTPKGELPSVLVDRADLHVGHGDDPGDYYCEHALYMQQLHAKDVGILKNAQDESMVGFLHIPDDEHSSKDPDAPIDAAQRYARHREVIGAAVFGFFHEAKAMTQDDLRILITGYGPFMSIRNNPAGGFVSDASNFDAAMQHAFGDALLTKQGAQEDDRRGAPGADTMTLRYVVRDQGKERVVLLTGEKLDVADAELSQDDPQSLIGAMRDVRPHAMLSLGVHGGSGFKVEHHADDGGLVFDAQGKPTHDGGKSPTHGFNDNWALARAIYSRYVNATPVVNAGV